MSHKRSTRNTNREERKDTNTEKVNKTANNMPYTFHITDTITTIINENVVLYEISFCTDKSEFEKYYRYSQLYQYYLELVAKAQELKCNQPPEFAPRKPFSFSKTSKQFINQRLKALNVYFKNLLDYLTKHKEMARIVEKQFELTLSTFVRLEDEIMLNYLLKYTDDNLNDNKCNSQDRSGAVALHYCVSQQNSNIIEKFLTKFGKQISVTIYDRNGWNPLSLSHFFPQTKNDAKSQKIYQLLSSHFRNFNDMDSKGDNDNGNFDTYIKYPQSERIPLHYSKNTLMNKRHLFVLVNPISGKGKAKHIWSTFLKPMFTKQNKNISYHVIMTKHVGHGIEICQKLDLNKYDTVVAVGGDGTMSGV